MIAAIQLAVYTGFGMIIPILPKIVEKIGAAPVHLGFMLAVYSAVSFLMSPIWGSYSDRVGRRPVILSGLFGFSLSFFIFAISNDHLWIMYISRIIGGLSAGALSSVAMAYAADISSEEERTKSMGIVGMTIGIGFILGPAIGGIFSIWGPYIPFFGASILTFAMLIVAFFILKESLQSRDMAEERQGKLKQLAAFRGKMKYLYTLAFFVAFSLAGLESTFQFFQMAKIGATVLQVGIMFGVVGVVEAIMQGGIIRLFTQKMVKSKGLRLDC